MTNFPWLMKIWPAILVAVLLAGCQSAGPSVSVSYYTVSGQTQSELDKSIRETGPDNGDALALASIQLIPDVKLRAGRQGCRVTSARIKVKADVTLPRWAERRFTQDHGLGRAWDNLEAYAAFHEAVHVAIAQGFAKRLEAILLALPPEPDCTAMDVKALIAARAVLKQHHAAQIDFDLAEKKRLAAL